MGVYALGASVTDANERCMYGWATKENYLDFIAVSGVGNSHLHITK